MLAMAALPPDATEYILGELTRRLNEVAGRLEVGLNRLDAVYVRRDVYDQATALAKQERDTIASTCKTTGEELERRVDKLEESRQWLFRLSVGALVSAFVSLLVAVVMVSTGLK